MAKPNEQIQDEIDRQKKAFALTFLSFSQEDPYTKQRTSVLTEYKSKLISLRKQANELGILPQYAKQLDELQYKYECNTHHILENIDPNNLYQGKARFNNNSGFKDKIIEHYNANYNPVSAHVLAEGPETESDAVRFFENLLFNPRFGQQMPTDILVAGELTHHSSDSFFPYFKHPINYSRDGHVVKTTITDLNPDGQLSGISHYEINIQFDGKQKTIRVHHINKFPDHDLPQLEPLDYLALLEMFQNSRATGLITHCRAGLGRTGMMELAYLSFINRDKFFNKDGTVNYAAFTDELVTMRTHVRPRIVQGIKQGMKAIEIGQKLIQLYLTLKSAHEELQQKSYLGDKHAFDKLLNYYQTGKPAFEYPKVRENDFIAWSGKIIASEKISENSKQALHKEIEFRNQIKLILDNPHPQDHLEKLSQQDSANAIRILCDSQLSERLGMDKCIGIIFHFQNQRELFFHHQVKQDYLIALTTYALRNVTNAKQCLMSDNLREMIDKRAILSKYISEPQFYASMSLEQLRRVSGNFDFLARFTDCTQAVSPDVLKKAEEFYSSGQLTAPETESVKRFLTLQYAIKQVLNEKGSQSAFVTAINFEGNNVNLLISIRVNNYTENHLKMQLSHAELEKRANAYRQLPAPPMVQNVASQATSNRHELRHQQHLLMMQKRAASATSRNTENADHDQEKLKNRPGIDGK